MRLHLDLPASLARTSDGAILAPGVTLRVGPFQQLPLDLAAWRDQVLAAGGDRSALRVVAAVDRTTDGGWPVALVVTEASGVRRLHAFYRFILYGVVAVVEGATASFDPAMDGARQLLVSARPDFSTEVPRAVHEVWAGF